MTTSRACPNREKHSVPLVQGTEPRRILAFGDGICRPPLESQYGLRSKTSAETAGFEGYQISWRTDPATSWRRERDSNPRYGFPYTHFPGVRLQPLGHLSSTRAATSNPAAGFCKPLSGPARTFPQALVWVWESPRAVQRPARTAASIGPPQTGARMTLRTLRFTRATEGWAKFKRRAQRPRDP
jgi:hypothetical protein